MSILPVLLACLLGAPKCAPQTVGGPTILNGDFSADKDANGLPDDWQAEKYRGNPVWGVAKGGGPDGSDCARIECKTNEDIGLFSQRVAVGKGGGTYRVVVQLKTTPGTRATVSCTSYSATDKWLDANYNMIVAAGETEWVTRGGYFRHNDQGAAIKLALWCSFQGGEPGTAWFDNVRIERVDGIPPIRYQPEHPEPTLTQEDQARGFLLFERNYLSLLCREYNPGPDERLKQLRSFASQGEYEPSSFGVYAARELREVRATVGDLKSDTGATIPADRFEVRHVRHLPKRSHYSRQDRMIVPTFLDSKPAPIAAGYSAQVWITVHVPEDAAGGVYRGAVTVSAGSGEQSVPVELRVFPFRLKEPADKWFGMYDGLGLPGLPDDLDTRYADMRRHGLTTVGFAGSLGGKYSVEGDRVRADLEESALAAVVAAYRKAGFPAPLVWLIGSDVKGYALKHAGGDLKSDKFADAYKEIVKAVLRHGRLNEWPAIYFQPEDEVFAHTQRFEEGLRQLKLLKEAEALTEMDGPNVDAERAKQTYVLTDMLVYAYGPLLYRERVYSLTVWETMVNQFHADGKKLLYYNFDTTGYHPESMRFSNGFYIAATHADGILNWAYSWARDPYGEQDDVAGDVQFYYPKTDKEAGGPSIGYEGIREGVDDYKYWYTLTELVKEAKAKGVPTAGADQLLASLLADLDLSHLRTNMSMQGDWEYDGANERGDEVRRGPFKLPVAWQFAAYDQKRLELAEAIEALARQPGAR
jgi:hypothetical protein